MKARYTTPLLTKPNVISDTVNLARTTALIVDTYRCAAVENVDVFAVVDGRLIVPQNTFRLGSVLARDIVGAHEVEKTIVAQYRDIIGDRGLNTFQTHVLPMAYRSLCGMPKIVEEVLSKLIDQASYLKPHEVETFWQTRVTTETFEFQRRYDELRQMDGRHIPGFVFHVTKRDLLSRINELVPEAMRRNLRLLDEDEFAELNRGYHIVNTAHGTIDELALYLAGHAFLHWCTTIDYKHETRFMLDLFDDDSHDHFCNFAVAAVRKEAVIYGGPHEIETPYDRRQGFVDVYESEERVPISHVIQMPLTVLTDDQIEQLRMEGEAFFRQKISAGAADPYLQQLIDANITGRVFAMFNKRALVMKYALLKFMEGI